MHRDFVPIKAVEGMSIQGNLLMHKLIRGKNGLLLEFHISKGAFVPQHKHSHESFCFLKTGKMLVNIEDREIIVDPGDVWYQPENTIHHTVGLEDSTWLEFKTPSEEPFSI